MWYGMITRIILAGYIVWAIQILSKIKAYAPQQQELYWTGETGEVTIVACPRYKWLVKECF